MMPPKIDAFSRAIGLPEVVVVNRDRDILLRACLPTHKAVEVCDHLGRRRKRLRAALEGAHWKKVFYEWTAAAK